MRNSVALCLVVLLAAGCSQKEHSWSELEKENSIHFYYSLEASNAATVLSNDIAQGKQPRSNMSEVVSLRGIALEEANLVEDSVLLKAHDELPQKFHNLYKKSLEYSIQALENDDNQASIRYSVLADQWGNWYRRNRRNIRIPK